MKKFFVSLAALALTLFSCGEPAFAAGGLTTTTVGCYFLAVSFATGLTAVTGGTAGDITISYR